MLTAADSQKLWYLKNYDIFQGIPLKDIKKVATEATIKECKSECTINRNGRQIVIPTRR